jgi:ATP adenylyltransferase
MSETLWAPWRMDFILSDKDDECVFCRASEAPPEKHAELLVLATRPAAFVILNRYPYTHGHFMIVPRRHVSRIEDLPPDERAGFLELMVDSQSLLRATLAPHGINIGMNLGRCAGAGIEDHIHIHVVPRWDGDTNFMPLLADARVMPEHLAETYRKLRSSFERLDRK